MELLEDMDAATAAAKPIAHVHSMASTLVSRRSAKKDARHVAA